MKTSSRVILKAASQIYNESADEILKRRTARYVRIRMAMYHASRNITKESIAHTARILGKDHTTLLHSLKKEKPEGLDAEIARLERVSLNLAQQMRDNTLQWTALTCYNNDDRRDWKLQNG